MNVSGVGMCIQSLLIAVLIVCSTNGFLELFSYWPLATVKRLYLMYGKPEVSCNSLVDMYLGKRSASLMKEFCNFCNFRSLVTVSETVIVELPHIRNQYCSYTLFIDLQNCLSAWSSLLIDQHSYAMIFLLAAF